ncbi:hypothetical protein CRUP_036411 [Coryphaenoides rupestris]|nr:hypothetical protein CRUP_036411 [Coryphaenoides rupestris]
MHNHCFPPHFIHFHIFLRETLPGQFKFKEYCPQVFRNLRERFGIEDQDFQVSLARSSLVKDGDGQGDRLLLTSYDRTLVVKKITSEEVADMHNILSEYHQHIVTCHGNTLLPQFLAMYRVSVDEDAYLLVTRNMFSHRLHIHRKYDLKVKELPTYKDVDFRNNMQKVYVSDEEKEKILDKLNRDVEFLVQMHIMDYSLLLGIHDVERAEQEEEGEGEVVEEEGEVYFMGLIDVLTHYDTRKKAAHAAKTAGAEISTVHPEQYAKRFLEFICNIFA